MPPEQLALVPRPGGKRYAAPRPAALWPCDACLAPCWFVGAAVTKGAGGRRHCHVEVVCSRCGDRQTFTAAQWWVGPGSGEPCPDL